MTHPTREFIIKRLHATYTITRKRMKAHHFTQTDGKYSKRKPMCITVFVIFSIRNYTLRTLLDQLYSIHPFIIRISMELSKSHIWYSNVNCYGIQGVSERDRMGMLTNQRKQKSKAIWLVFCFMYLEESENNFQQFPSNSIFMKWFYINSIKVVFPSIEIPS